MEATHGSKRYTHTQTHSETGNRRNENERTETIFPVLDVFCIILLSKHFKMILIWMEKIHTSKRLCSVWLVCRHFKNQFDYFAPNTRKRNEIIFVPHTNQTTVVCLILSHSLSLLFLLFSLLDVYFLYIPSICTMWNVLVMVLRYVSFHKSVGVSVCKQSTSYREWERQEARDEI